MNRGDSIMLLDLSNVLSEQHKSVDEIVSVSFDEFRLRGKCYPILSKEDAHIQVEYVGNQKLKVSGTSKLTIGIPCDRCLEEVPVDFNMDFVRDVETKEAEVASDEADQLDENNYIDGYHLDVEKLLYNEILVGWPMKVLCSEDCKGICSVCGQNLNEGTCSCEDTGLDPRMSVIRDVFKNFKEV